MDSLILTNAIYVQMVQHAQEALPDEVVGLLGGGSGGRVEAVYPLPNLAGFRAFLADPWAQYQAERALQHAGLELLAIYHSHPGGSAGLSQSDRVFAAKRRAVQIVIALACPHHIGEEVRAYRLENGLAHEVELQIIPDR